MASVKKKKSIPDIIKAYADGWRKEMLEGAEDEGNRYRDHHCRNPLKEYVDETLERVFKRALLLHVGIQRDSFDRIELLESKDNESPYLIELLLKKVRKRCEAKLVELLQPENIQLSSTELRHLRAHFRRRLLDELEGAVTKKAEERALEMAEHELDAILMSDEWVSLAEARMTKKTA